MPQNMQLQKQQLQNFLNHKRRENWNQDNQSEHIRVTFGFFPFEIYEICMSYFIISENIYYSDDWRLLLLPENIFKNTTECILLELLIHINFNIHTLNDTAHNYIENYNHISLQECARKYGYSDILESNYATSWGSNLLCNKRCKDAVASGSLLILQWLRKNNCSCDAWDVDLCETAVKYEYHDILEWLQENTYHHNSMESDRSNVLKWSIENYYSWEDSDCLNVMYSDHCIHAIKWRSENSCMWN